MLTYADVCHRILKYADVCSRMQVVAAVVGQEGGVTWREGEAILEIEMRRGIRPDFLQVCATLNKKNKKRACNSCNRDQKSKCAEVSALIFYRYVRL